MLDRRTEISRETMTCEGCEAGLQKVCGCLFFVVWEC